jgi:hypothetical protein
MKKLENQCCGCATDNYPCRGRSCPNVNVKVYYCDKCKSRIEGDVYEADGYDLCEWCLKGMFIKGF